MEGRGVQVGIDHHLSALGAEIEIDGVNGHAKWAGGRIERQRIARVELKFSCERFADEDFSLRIEGARGNGFQPERFVHEERGNLRAEDLHGLPAQVGVVEAAGDEFCDFGLAPRPCDNVRFQRCIDFVIDGQLGSEKKIVLEALVHPGVERAAEICDHRLDADAHGEGEHHRSDGDPGDAQRARDAGGGHANRQ